MSVPSSLSRYLLMPPTVTSHEGVTSTVEAVYRFDLDFPGFDGHFPGNPIVPGIVQIMLVVRTACHDSVGQLQGIKRCKFTRPVRPFECLKIVAEITDKETERFCKATLWVEDEPSAIMSLTVIMQP